MDKRAELVVQTLRALNVPSDINSVDERKHIQKAIYLAERIAGVPLGYEFNWYVMGPYSPALTDTYYDPDFKSAKDSRNLRNLRADLVEKLQRVSEVMVEDKPTGLSDHDWFELVASWHFLRDRRGLPIEQAKTVLEERKRHVSQYADKAEQVRMQLASPHGS